MAQKYEIEIGVSARGKAGKTRSGANAEIAEQIASSRRKSELGKDPTKKGGAGQTLSTNNKLLQQLSKSIPQLTKAVNTLSKKPTGRGSGVGTGLGGGRGKGGAGGGMGGMGASIPVVGAMVAALGFVMAKVTQVGRAYMQVVSQQRGTAGIGGYYGGGSTTAGYQASEVGQFAKSRYLARGSIGARNERTELGQMGTASQYARLFGIGGGEFGKTVGTMDLFSGNKGLGTLQNITQKYGGKGGQVSAELQFMVQTITSSMQDAVKEGVNDSDMATDMAKELTSFSKFLPNQQLRGGAAIQKNLMQIQKGVAYGSNVGTLPGFEMLRAGRQVLRKGLMNDPKMQAQFLKLGMINKDELFQFQKTGKMPETETMMTQTLMTQNKAAVRRQFAKNVVTPFSGIQGMSKSRQMGRFHNVMQPYLNMNPVQMSSLYKSVVDEVDFERISGGLGGKTSKEDWARLVQLAPKKGVSQKASTTGLSRGAMGRALGKEGAVRTVRNASIAQEGGLLGAGHPAMLFVVQLDTALRKMATSDAIKKLASGTLPQLGKSLTDLASLGASAINGIMGTYNTLKQATESVGETMVRIAKGNMQSNLQSKNTSKFGRAQ